MPTTRKTSAAKKPAAKTRKTKPKAATRKAPAAKAKPAKKAARVTAPVEEVTIKDKPATGRPTLYTEEIANTICERLIEGQTIREIAEDENMPSKRTITRWATEPEHPFWPLYVRAREAQCIGMAEEILEISDDGSNDWMQRQGKDGETSWQLNGEHIQRSKLRVDTRKWVLSKVLPRVYGDKVTAEHTGKNGGPIQVEDVGEMEMARRVAFALGRALTKKQQAEQIEDAQIVDET